MMRPRKKSNKNNRVNHPRQKLNGENYAKMNHRYEKNPTSDPVIFTASIKKEHLNIEFTPQDTEENLQTISTSKTLLFQCIECEKSFAHKQSLNLHQRVHTGVKPFCCDVCGESFARSDYYLAHRRKHNIESKPEKGFEGFRCDICNKVFAYRHVLRRHQALHNNELNFTCGICDEKFFRRDYLTAHERKLHAKGNLFKCGSCDQVFNYKNSLVIHERKHTGERPYACCYCDKQYIRKDYMQRHQFTHKLECDKFTCDFCNNVFKNKNDLRDHILKHLDNRECSVESNLLITEEEGVQVFINNGSCYNDYYSEIEVESSPSIVREEMTVAC